MLDQSVSAVVFVADVVNAVVNVVAPFVAICRFMTTVSTSYGRHKRRLLTLPSTPRSFKAVDTKTRSSTSTTFSKTLKLSQSPFFN